MKLSAYTYILPTHMLAGQPWGLGLGTFSPALCWTMFKFLNIGDETLQRICLRKLYFWVREEKADTVIVWQSPPPPFMVSVEINRVLQFFSKKEVASCLCYNCQHSLFLSTLMREINFLSK